MRSLSRYRCSREAPLRSSSRRTGARSSRAEHLLAQLMHASGTRIRSSHRQCAAASPRRGRPRVSHDGRRRYEAQWPRRPAPQPARTQTRIVRVASRSPLGRAGRRRHLQRWGSGSWCGEYAQVTDTCTAARAAVRMRRRPGCACRVGELEVLGMEHVTDPAQHPGEDHEPNGECDPDNHTPDVGQGTAVGNGPGRQAADGVHPEREDGRPSL